MNILDEIASLKNLKKAYKAVKKYNGRPKKGTIGALKEVKAHMERGKTRLVDIDLEKFFDEVNQSRLMWQGSPLSPLLSNLVLDELDQELTRR